jgi:uncharacterized damage-inducible protein DinB
MILSELQNNEYSPFYKGYIKQSVNRPIVEGLKLNLDHTLHFYNNIPFEKLDFRYADGKWTIKEILQHIIDTERIFSYRALRIARQDQTPLPGFEQDDYVLTANTNERSIESLINEYIAVRQATIELFDSFNNKMLLTIGTASENPISVRAIGFIITGHENHHTTIIKERYL